MAVDYPKPRVSIGVREALMVAGILVVAVVAWLLLRGFSGDSTAKPPAGESSPTEVLAAVTGDAAAPTAPLPGLPAPDAGTAVGEPATAATAAVVVVSVVGAVEHSGLVTLPEGARVADALETANPLPGAQLIALNQAQRLSDGEQIFVPAEGEEITPPGAAPVFGAVAEAENSVGENAAGLISLNTAGVTELTQLNGVGEKTAEAIISHREQIGGFTDLDQLLEVKGIGPAKHADLVDQVSL